MGPLGSGNWLAACFLAYSLTVVAVTGWLIGHPLEERREFLREPGLSLTGEGDEERLTAQTVLAAMQLDPEATRFKDYADQYLSRLSLVAKDGSTTAELTNSYDYQTLPDFDAISDIPTRKKAFFDYLRPAIERQNQLIRERRLLLKGIEIRLAQGQTLTAAQQRYMALVRERYRVAEDVDDSEAVATLMRRMDTIPTSMVLAQAAIESAWGRSRFAREANNLFGQWCFSQGCGVVPNDRPEGETYEVAKFANVEEAIAAYFQNINAFHRYSSIREIRERARANNQPLKGYDMVAGLEAYSSRGQAYIDELRNLIRYNKLEDAPSS
ncbi:glucosaminidase domain-containing protein [Simiduia sp. 21SJ11W-1]|uniref:glucosaminidase domain-containing protein n=1 Tax=Simiduia sp. 21SJ11W-1 TaxID=2909669 RepID=UPI00209D8051|nr:glucosaminidase domain-containing protein [Simiduia sp. 21SJ11W-1]UTA47746.1 glucosaminidase domain-containing protein [Simiduia sp. 21SJ11W-1]